MHSPVLARVLSRDYVVEVKFQSGKDFPRAEHVPETAEGDRSVAVVA